MLIKRHVRFNFLIFTRPHSVWNIIHGVSLQIYTSELFSVSQLRITLRFQLRTTGRKSCTRMKQLFIRLTLTATPTRLQTDHHPHWPMTDHTEIWPNVWPHGQGVLLASTLVSSSTLGWRESFYILMSRAAIGHVDIHDKMLSHRCHKNGARWPF